VKRALTAEEESSLLTAARQVQARARATYSKFHVGSALLDAEGRIHVGCNVEAASYGLTMCGERSAIFSAIASGAREFLGIAQVGEGDGPLVPCGACRQVLWDQCGDIAVLCANSAGALWKTTLKELLPHAFELGGPE
jgi:cytidine deaminase